MKGLSEICGISTVTEIEGSQTNGVLVEITIVLRRIPVLRICSKGQCWCGGTALEVELE